MPSGWQARYAELKEYIAGKPQIKINSKVIAIPGDFRPEFYRLFDTVRVAFLRDNFSVQLSEADTLSKNYAQTEEEMANLLGVVEISLTTSLSWFLRDPINGLMRGLFDPLFNLLKGKTDVDIFELAAASNIKKSFTQLYHLGYEKWVVLSLAKSLAPGKIFEVPIAELDEDAAQMEWDTIPGAHEDVVAEPVEAKSLTLSSDELVPFVVPYFVVHSAAANRYVSINAGMVDAFWTAKNLSDNRDWYSRKSLNKDYYGVKWPDFMVYASDEMRDVTLIADYKKICRPDLAIVCMDQEDWYQAGELERIKLTHAMTRPKMGTYVVSLKAVPEAAFTELLPQPVASEPPPEAGTEVAAAEGDASEPAPEAAAAEPEEQEPGIHILIVGVDSSKLAPIIEAVAPVEEDAGEPVNQ